MILDLSVSALVSVSLPLPVYPDPTPHPQASASPLSRHFCPLPALQYAARAHHPLDSLAHSQRQSVASKQQAAAEAHSSHGLLLWYSDIAVVRSRLVRMGMSAALLSDAVARPFCRCRRVRVCCLVLGSASIHTLSEADTRGGCEGVDNGRHAQRYTCIHTTYRLGGE
jgi:hypothetical protein